MPTGSAGTNTKAGKNAKETKLCSNSLKYSEFAILELSFLSYR